MSESPQSTTSQAIHDANDTGRSAQKKSREKRTNKPSAKASTASSQRRFIWVHHEELIVEWNRSNGEDPVTMAELAASIAECGILDPVHIRADKQLSKYRVIAGRRRVIAFALANKLRIEAGRRPLKKVPCILSEPEDKAGEAMVDLITNYAREGLSALDRAKLLKRSADEQDCTAKELAEKLKLSKGTVSETLSILRLPDEALERIKAGESAKQMCRNWWKLSADCQMRVAAGESLKDVVAEWKAGKGPMPHVNGKDASGQAMQPAESLHSSEHLGAVNSNSTKREDNDTENGAVPAAQAGAPQQQRLKMLPSLVVQLADVAESEEDRRRMAGWCLAVLRPAAGLEQDLDRKAAAYAAVKMLSLLKDE